MFVRSSLLQAVEKRKLQVKPIVRSKWVLKGLSFACRSRLPTLAMLHGTDKLAHGYIPRYECLLGELRNKKFNLLEIGIGGYEGHTFGGESLRMWKAYFPHAQIHGLDILEKSHVAENRISVWRGSQVDAELLRRIHELSGGFHVIIDDGSHRNSHIIATFETLFPLLNCGGIYFIEDVQTSYWPEYEGRAVIHDDTPSTSMGYFKRMADRLNHEEFRVPDLNPHPLDEQMDSIFFWHNLISIRKCARKEKRIQ